MDVSFLENTPFFTKNLPQEGENRRTKFLGDQLTITALPNVILDAPTKLVGEKFLGKVKTL